MDKLERIILGICIGICIGIFCGISCGIGLKLGLLHNSDIRELKKVVKELCSDDEEKADQMYYEEMFSQPKMNLFGRNPIIIIPAYDEMFILRHPELKKYFVREVSPQEIFSTKLNIDFSDGTWQLSVDEHTTELVKAQFSRDGKFVLVSGIKEGNSIINISREDEAYSFSIFVKVEEPEEWYEKWQEEMKSIPKRR